MAQDDLPYRPNVGIMLANAGGRIFIAQRADSPGPAWQMPQGGIDAGEDPQAAALRELEEETGIGPDLVRIEARLPEPLCYDFPEELQGRLWKGGYRGQCQTWFLMRFLGSDAQVNLQTEHPEFTTWRWAGPDEVLALVVPFKRHVYEAVLKAFGPMLPSGAAVGRR